MTSATGETRQAGFTLIELLVVLAILVGLSAAFPLAWERLSPQRQVQIYARTMLSDLQWLRARAMSRNVVGELKLADTAHEYQLEPEGTHRVLPEGIAVRVISAAATPETPSVIRFFPDGSSTGGEVILERAGRSARLSVSSLSGRVSEE